MIPSASQTIGPYWHLIQEPSWSDLTRFGAQGDAITLSGRITDGADAPVTDAAIELFQATPPRSASFPGYGRAASDAEGNFRFITLKPSPSPGPAGLRGNTLQAPHCGLAILARGLLKPLFTRLYFADEPLNETDPILALIEPPSRRATLIAQAVGARHYHLDIALQGAAETVFLEF
ncbi:MAG TPA: protocatechuate 3,4-dioxygenase subunit alpha [Acidiphilium sp.]|nr:MAG: protocatechuate 3,4-dioxygenase subunit alpha [Acidiphilium sp. 21-60-14]OYV91867.1 MAG: protocatechuate 3,4-dioxygenase subunit alpha [Acidiphilium sp. 37-60-79]OZB41235.1 MAG: protocatechuate 3,4-dioxygenase subunit alpha [Acidiphilium sp. 34-60-192]HQT88023.1 protocatechuate 3,4-dioxygenase subunit alpha [Acidiphilium sp.]HQU23061.1 protocatechuate 3,4-dioxygenase subunit alpha [Acidiphilium sp.]